MEEISTVQMVVIAILPMIFAITVHEVAHGWVANMLGDPTAKFLGRLTLNPLKHIDILGTVVLPLLMIIFFNFAFGWAKPVPITWQNLRHPRRDMALVAVAGPAANFLMALGWGIVLILTQAKGEIDPQSMTAGFGYMAAFGIQINLLLMALNLIPIPPLDGSRVVSSCLSPRLALVYNRIEPYGFFILLALIFTGGLQYLIAPFLNGGEQLLLSLLHLFLSL